MRCTLNLASLFLARATALAAAFTVLAAPGRAQAINVDCVLGMGSPSNAYGAAAGQSGTWNAVQSQVARAALVDVNGAATVVTLGGLDNHFELGFDNPGTSGDDELLMDDFLDGDGTYVFAGLADGDYEVYTYAWAPDQAAFVSRVSVAGSPDPDQDVGGPWPDGHALGVTYARHQVTVSGGSDVFVTVTGTVGFSSTNGFQIVPATPPMCAPPETYCTAKVNSCRTTPVLGFAGTPSVSATSGFTVESSGARAGKLGIWIYSNTGRRIPASVFGAGGFLCLNAPVRRSDSFMSQGGTPGPFCDGRFVFDVNAFRAGLAGGNPQAYLSIPGTVVVCQIWGRDSFVHGDFLSEALEFAMCP